MTAPLLELRDLSVLLSAGKNTAEILSSISLTLARGERLGIVGESGSGKSITALAVMGLLPQHMDMRGGLSFNGQDLASLSEKDRCKMRGRQMAMIFQEPMTALNPIKSIGSQISEGRRLHLGENRTDAEHMARRLLDRVGLSAPRFDLGLYPHQLSGGQRQRVMIAMALACEPELLIADEPTTALDVTVQAQILDLLDELIEESGTALLLITHDLGVVSEMTDRLAVMYAGRVIETGPTQDVFRHMAHPYTRGLFAASPHSLPFGQLPRSGKRQRLSAIAGVVPDPFSRLPQCGFADRCRFVENDCRASVPPLLGADFLPAGQKIACLHPFVDEVVR
ncbi:ABC transporter ATP-binding protein [Pseudochrobactrum sp. sp1633]|uniref:ABC transporter ATP-binding protein n=1 Tax=Pseudochrobactrum sp. sp1633 TaxID=3036706 RepID=UPI0025A562E8|nr:ABC transporter ATP-binding protein [Pseudochrobactrum sp. sp1633]MDM8344478.1 ABC transporter ATP-binding protein [Pseudochrobactrum sp. sp1633]HWD14390.1 ABC transporter ATP-binding protein [Pseudochrobactrum sp.]